MANIKPFKAIRPAKEYEKVIPSLPYDVFNRHEAKKFVEKNPHSFLAIDRPETQRDDKFDMYSQESYEIAKNLLEEWILEGSLIQDNQDCYYLYELTMNGRSQSGLVACVNVDDYNNNVIKKNENTRKAKEQDRINHVYTCKAQTGPIFLACKDRDDLNEIFAKIKENTPEYDINFDDGITHKIWVISDSNTINELTKTFKDINQIYIADGHHRCASAAKVAEKLRQENPNYTGKEEFNYIMSVIFPASVLNIMDYNRVVKDLNGLTKDEFIDSVQKYFYIDKTSTSPIKPESKNTISMYLKNQWYSLSCKEEIKNNGAVEGLDVTILQKYVLDEILGIKDPKTDERIDFVGGIKGLKELEVLVNSDFSVAFAMYPTSMSELMNVADAELLMPPKSTWFEPKLRSGFFIHRI